MKKPLALTCAVRMAAIAGGSLALGHFIETWSVAALVAWFSLGVVFVTY